MTPAQHPKQKDMYRRALAEIGLQEIRGSRHNARVVEMFRKVGWPQIKDDETAWCGAALGTWAIEAGLPIPDTAIRAQEWHKQAWGVEVPHDEILPGDIYVGRRSNPSRGTGHVAHVKEVIRDATGKITGFILVGGNQSSQVNAQRYNRFDKYGDTLLSIRRWPGSSIAPTIVGDSQKAQPLLVMVIVAVLALFGLSR